MPDSITQAQPPLEFIPPAFNPLIYHATKLALPAWVRWQVQLVDIQVKQTERLLNLYQQFQAGNIRFMMAFRHPSTNDPYSLYYLLSQCLPKAAKQQGMKLQYPLHAHFMYDRGIPLWAGEWTGQLYAGLGGTPIRRGKLDLVGLRSARQLFTDGRFPMAAAPEGATNGHNEIVNPIEPGVSQLGFWCQEDLQKARRTEQVMIVPIGIQYHYVSTPWQAIEQLLSELEADVGIATESRDNNPGGMQAVDFMPSSPTWQNNLYKRLIRLGERLLSLMEDFYRKFYHQSFAPIAPAIDPGQELSVNQQIAQRLQALMNAALRVTEDYFGIQPKGNVNDRCRRLEQAGWDRIYREDLKQLENLPAVERGLADRIAEEANLRLWHMRLVESFVSVTGQYVLEKPTVERFAETSLLLWDMVARIKGKNPFLRPKLGAQRVQMTIGTPLSVSDRWEAYQANRRQAVAQLTQDLQTALESMIEASV